MNDTDRRIHKLGQAAQIGDLLAERVHQYLEEIDAHFDQRLPGNERVRMCRENLDRAMGAYRSVRN